MSEDVDRGGKGFLSSALLVAAVSAILLAGLALRSAPPVEAAKTAPAPPKTVPTLALGSPITPDPGVAAASIPSDPQASADPDPVPAETPPPAKAAAVHVAQPIAAPAQQPAHEPAPDPLVLKLATRAEADSGRLTKAKGRFTAQLLVACKAETVDRLLGAGAGSTKIYVLPAQVKADACFRVCYGTYATAKDAAAAADLPKALRGKDKIGAVEIAKVLQ
jgi:septal ring-binding cell division protein DamX